MEYKDTFFDITSQQSMLNSLLVSKIIKEKSDIYVCIIDHQYEHFSLNNMKVKITDDHPFFLYIDGIIKYKEEKDLVIDKLIDAIKSGKRPKGFLTLDNLKNFKCNNKIINKVVPNIEVFSYNPVMRFELIGGCSWRKCTFCIHNNKYLAGHKYDINLKNIFIRIKRYIDSGYIYFSFTGEELSPTFLNRFSNFLLENNIKIKWQCRCRIDLKLDIELLRLMNKAGCIGILFGVETISKKVLKKMNKYDKVLNKNEILKVIDNVNKVGMDVHINLIFGFPGEEEVDILENKSFFKESISKYNNISCWVNLFQLFKESRIFNNPNMYGIKKLENNNDFTYRYDFVYLFGQYSNKNNLYVKFNQFNDYIFSVLGWNVKTLTHIQLLLLYNHTCHGIL